MKKRLLATIKIVGVLLIIAGIALLAVILQSENDTAVIKEYAKNESLPTIKTDWRGTPVDEKNRFVNDEFPYLPKVSDLIKWQLSANPQKEEKAADDQRLEIKDPTAFLNSDADGILWFGHASFLIRLNGIVLLIDPVFGDPSYITPLVSVPSPLEKLRRVDYIIISHDHRDHCDETTIKQLTAKFPEAKILAGLRMDDLLKDWNSSNAEIQTAGWYQQFNLPDDKLKIYFTPSRHWSRRGLFDTNQRLWGAFVIQGAGQTIYFGGDSGYDGHYKELAALFPKIDYFIVGIGAYKPRFIMKPNHSEPAEALQAFLDSCAAVLIPMHFGRFDLSNEPPSEPLRLLKEAAAEKGVSEKIKNLQINESISFNEQ
ncbi:MAG: MBL fold metallo-hydrolase [Acidobacteriota bacterium]|nr:MBL fold metallo-hydrolase [Acidobacteriota bacterium]